MADFLTAVRSVRNKQDGEGGDALLTAVGSRDLRASSKTASEAVENTEKKDGALSDGISVKTSGSPRDVPKDGHDATDSRLPSPLETPADALQVLRSQPNFNTLIATLEQLNGGAFSEPFSLDAPGPLQAQIINTLLSETVPTFWPALKTNRGQVLLPALTNVAGLNAVVARLRLLASQKAPAEDISDLLDVATKLFARDDVILSVCSGIQRSVKDDTKLRMLRKEVVSLLGSGKVIAAVAQAEDAVRASSKSGKTQSSWLANGSEYCAWLGRGIAHISQSSDTSKALEDAASLLAKGLQLGRPAQLLASLLWTRSTDGNDTSHDEQVRRLTHSLSGHAKRTFLEHLLRWLSSSILPDDFLLQKSKAAPGISAAAGLLSILVEEDERMRQHLEAQLSDPTLSSALSLPVRRACVATLARQVDGDGLKLLLEKLISTFSSTLFIAHAPVAQQESLAQTILVAAGYVHRKAPMSLLMTARSSGHMQGVSNRLDSSNVRARWLGMVVGTALSKLVDKPGSQMNFGTDELQSEDAIHYTELVNIKDSIGSLDDFDTVFKQSPEHPQQASEPRRATGKASKKPATINGKPVYGPPRPPAPAQTKIIGDRVTEILDEESHQDSDLKPYAKPDSDPEDSDEDATLVNRDKHRAPVYIRDLMAGLRDDKTFDRFNLALENAASLIRRKANFGKEVKDHAEELGGMLCNLQDPFDIDNFDDLRLQALVAVLLSDVKVIAPMLSRQAFAEGYSISQRCVILSALGLGGRELAGFKIEDEDFNPKLSNTNFPSKKLPPRLHAIYNPSQPDQTKRLQAASQSIEQQMIQPMALQAADQSTSHLNAVKIRTFSSRMDVEKARTKRKPPANELAKCFGECFFFPLANRYQQEISAYGSGSVYASAPFVLVTFIKTLALLLHASGPATLGLPQISAEMWDLLLSLRVQAINDISILQAVLFALLTLLEINTDKQRIVQEHPKQLMETQQWVDLVFERMGSSGLVDDDGKSEEAKVRTLAAGVLMKCREIVEAYQKQLVGYDFGQT